MQHRDDLIYLGHATRCSIEQDTLFCRNCLERLDQHGIDDGIRDELFFLIDDQVNLAAERCITLSFSPPKTTGSAEGIRLCEKRLSELLDKHKVAVDSKKRARIEDIQLLDDASIVALLRYHQIKYS